MQYFLSIVKDSDSVSFCDFVGVVNEFHNAILLWMDKISNYAYGVATTHAA